ncbi:MAG: hypothetical protein NVS2B16_26860 [Chloroflexota bacterium]
MMIADLPPEPWLLPLFTPEMPVEIVLSIAHAFCASRPDQVYGTPQETLDLNIARMLAAELYRRGAEYDEVPWPLRFEQARVPRKPEPPLLRRPEAR